MRLDSKKEIVNKMKELAKEIVSKEEEKYGVKININPITIGEYYKSDIFKHQISLVTNSLPKIIYNMTLPFNANGLYKSENVIVFIKYNDKIKRFNSEFLLADFVFTIYHEIKHRYQDITRKSNQISYETIIYDIERVIKLLSPKDYSDNHDEYYVEIDANKYGINNAIEYFKGENKLLEEQKMYLEILKNSYEYDYLNFDFNDFLNKFNYIFKNNEKIKIDLYPWLNIFYTKNKEFKKIHEILSNPIESNILKLFLTSKTFLESINFDQLSTEHQIIILNALKEIYHEEIIKSKMVNELDNQRVIESKKMAQLLMKYAEKLNLYIDIIGKYTEIMEKDNTNTEFLNKYYTELSGYSMSNEKTI